MKTIFKDSEIIAFISKKKDEVIADEILSRTFLKPESSDITSFNDMLQHIYKMGLTHGELEGRIKMVDELVSFFEL